MKMTWSKRNIFIAVVFSCLLAVSMFFALQKPVFIQIDGQTYEQRVFFFYSVEDVLKRQNISLAEKDSVEPDLRVKIKKDMIIKVTRAFKIQVVADGFTKEIITTPVSVAEAIKLAGFTLGDRDMVEDTALTEMVEPEQIISIVRVSEETIQEEQPIPFATESTSDDTLEKGLSRTIRRGQYGISLNTVKITYHNGKEVSRELISSERIKEPVNQIIALGNINSVSRGGQALNFREAKIMVATAYTYTGSRTATGTYPAVGSVAVDPSVIPLGTRLYIEGYGYGIACDTGAAIKGDRIDVFMEDRSQCLKWGKRTTKVYIL
ncbi:MAG: 3D domain-containing protein [Syntrophomonadaceae bacterium]|jgi:uncharacterized protein YabE (DUF348 family)